MERGERSNAHGFHGSRDRQGKKVSIGEIHLNENEIVADAALDEGDPSREEFEGYTGNAGMTLDRRSREIDRGALLASLVEAMMAVGADNPLARLIDHALASDKYDLTDAHLAAIFALESRLAKGSGADGAISRWLAECRRELENRTAQAPQKPADYRRAARLSCNCRDCRALSEFLADPDRREARLPRRLPDFHEGCTCGQTLAERWQDAPRSPRPVRGASSSSIEP